VRHRAAAMGQEGGVGETGTAASGTLLFAPHSALTIPRLGPDTPVHHVWRADAALVASLALDLMDAGLLTDADWRVPWSSESELVERCLNRWLGGLRNGWRHFNDLTVFFRAWADIYFPDEMHDHDDGDTPDGGFLLVYTGDGWTERFLRDRVLACEFDHPGLGRTAVSLLDTAAARTAQVLTPGFMHSVCEYGWWCGETEDNDVLAAHGMTVEDTQDIGLFLPSDFDAMIPRIITAPNSTLDASRLQAVAREDGLAGDVARACIDLLAVLGGRNGREAGRGRGMDVAWCGACYDVAFVLRWSPQDELWRLFDDYRHDTMNQGGTDMLAFAKYRCGALRPALLEIQNTFAILSKMDTLIDVISTED
jgi:PRTRC genetic system protein F